MRNIFILLATSLFLSGCQVVKVPEPTGGSRADGTIDLSYNVAQFEQPVVNWEEAQKKAKARCKAWGYKNAEAFGGGKTQCQAFGGMGGGCAQAMITNTYQCTK